MNGENLVSLGSFLIIVRFPRGYPRVAEHPMFKPQSPSRSSYGNFSSTEGFISTDMTVAVVSPELSQ